MKLKIKQNKLMEHLNYVIKGVSTKNLIPILNCIKMDLTEEGLYLLSTDNEIAIKTLIPKNEIEEIIELGSIVISGRYIYEIIRKLPNDFVNIEEVVDSKIYIYNDNSSFNLNCNNVSDFPDLNLEISKTPICLDKKVFKNIIAQTSFASSTQESRPVLTGINFKIDEDVLECVATDSYRLSKKVINLDENANFNVTIPAKTLNEIGKIDVGGAVGTDGYLNIIKQMNMSNQNYTGLVPLITGEIAEDFTEYFVKSEQKPTALALGVLVNKDGVKTSGGYVINLMPDATPDVIDKVEKALENSSGISRMLDFGLSLEEIAKRVTGDENVVLIEDNIEASYKCDCSKDKIERGIISLGENEIKDIIETDEKANIKCQFCNEEYNFSREDLENILKKIKE